MEMNSWERREALAWERDLQFQELVWIRCSVKDRVCRFFQPTRRSSLKRGGWRG